jgi:beta-galactosidase/beta-glucuronidase
MTETSQNEWSIVEGNLLTDWASKVDSENVLPEYPRPQLKRTGWLNLNGLWDYAITSKNIQHITSFDGKILVPFAIESALSGVKRPLKPNQLLWYRRFFEIPEAWKGNDLLLHFGAVDWKAEVWVNGNLVGEHKGGYVPFSFEISKFVKYSEENEIIISVWDPTNKGKQERGKQRLKSWLIFYTAVSGIWQTVWLEPVPKTRVEKLFLVPDIDDSQLNINPVFTNLKPEDEIQVNIKAQGISIKKELFKNEGPYVIDIPNQKLWNQENPFLYDLTLEILRKGEVIDKVESYFGMRKISIMHDNFGFPRLALNNEILFQCGVLDQGYWPDGLYTAPTDEALKFDIELAQQYGFNMIRKHLKIEPSRWYYHCDRLGMLVWQDMPNGGSFFAGIAGILFGRRIVFRYGRYKKSNRIQFYAELKGMIDSLHNHPSIVTWVLFNEGYGQFETKQVTEYVRILDNSRLINSASGWKDHKTGHIRDIHKYPGPAIPPLEYYRVAVLGEFGGYGYREKEHLWNPKKEWSYKRFDSREDLGDAFAELLIETLVLKHTGLGASIYTQLTDVEHEINGLITYNRKIPKIDFSHVKKFNEQLYKEEEEEEDD